MLLAMKTLIDMIRLPLTLKITTAQVVETWSSHCQQQYSGTGQDNHSPPSYESKVEWLIFMKMGYHLHQRSSVIWSGFIDSAVEKGWQAKKFTSSCMLYWILRTTIYDCNKALNAIRLPLWTCTFLKVLGTMFWYWIQGNYTKYRVEIISVVTS